MKWSASLSLVTPGARGEVRGVAYTEGETGTTGETGAGMTSLSVSLSSLSLLSVSSITMGSCSGAHCDGVGVTQGDMDL